MSLLKRLWEYFSNMSQSAATRRLLVDINQQIEKIGQDWLNTLQSDKSDKKNLKGNDYIVRDINGDELQSEWQDVDYVTASDIKELPAYQALKAQLKDYDIKLKLEDEQIEEVDDEERLRFILKVK